MLVDLGCRLVLVGHSERRHLFHETDDEINKRVGAALRHGLRPLLCVGETADERRQGLTFTVVEGQLRAALGGTEPGGDRPVLPRLRARLGDRHRPHRDAESGR